MSGRVEPRDDSTWNRRAGRLSPITPHEASCSVKPIKLAPSTMDTTCGPDKDKFVACCSKAEPLAELCQHLQEGR